MKTTTSASPAPLFRKKGKDFTLDVYRQLLGAFRARGYAFQAFEEYIIQKPAGSVLVLRHDVDRIPGNALKMARIEQEMGIKASYFFRVVPQVWDEGVIREIVALGHEAAYHYEDLAITGGNYEEAIRHFERQLGRLRQFYPSRTICMHGSPMARWDNRKLWERYDYRDFGIIAEPYFDIDYSRVFYVTDTGRAWNNSSISVRDKVDSGFDIPIRSTFHLISLLEEGRMPQHIMLNTHPHRWFDPGLMWFRELAMQNVKNLVKSFLVKTNG